MEQPRSHIPELPGYMSLRRPPACPTKIPQVRVWTRPTGLRTDKTGIPRQTSARLVKLSRICPLNSGNPTKSGFPSGVAVRGRVELQILHFSEGLSLPMPPGEY